MYWYIGSLIIIVLFPSFIGAYLLERGKGGGTPKERRVYGVAAWILFFVVVVTLFNLGWMARGDLIVWFP